MSGVALAWALAAGALVTFVPLHLLVIRITGPRWAVGMSVVLASVVGVALAFVALKVAGSAAAGETFAPRLQLRIHALAVYLYLALLILPFYSALDHSVRIRLCVEFFRCGRPELTLAQVLENYGLERAASRRWNKLAYGGYVAKDKVTGVLELTSKGRRVAAVSSAARRAYGLR